MAVDGLEESMMRSLASPDLLDLAIDWAELGLDAILDDGVLKNIPIIGSIVCLVGTAVSIRDKLFAKKLLLFLASLDKTTQEERQEQLQRLASDPKERRRLGEHLLLIIDRLNDMAKPALLARCFQVLLQGEIDRGKFLLLANVIDSLNVETIQAYKRGYESKTLGRGPIFDYNETLFLQAGLLSMQFAQMGNAATLPLRPEKFPTVSVSVSKIGSLFYKVVLKNAVVEDKKKVSL